MVERKSKSRGLGRGLSSLMGDLNNESLTSNKNSESQTIEKLVPVEKIYPNPNQPRKSFQEEKLIELANSIKTKGIVQPLIVRKKKGTKESFEIVAGERRWRAAQRAQIHELPVIIKEFTDIEVLEIAIIENVQRADLNPIEEALGYKNLMENFDHYAVEGTHLFNSFTCQPVCGPARASLQSGMYATKTGCFKNRIPLKKNIKTLAKYLSKEGYATGYIGKWHLGSSEPVKKEDRGGYDYWLGSNLLEFTSDAYETYVYDGQNKKVFLPGYRVDAITDAAINFIKLNQKKPFFLFVSLIEPHHQNNTDDYPPPIGYREKYTGKWSPPDLSSLVGSSPRHLGGYYGMVKRIDEAYGRMIDVIKSLKLFDDSAIIFTSDHGNNFKTRNREYKRSCHESSIRVPTSLIGNVFQQGGRIKELTNILDIHATILDLAKVKNTSHCDGKSVLPLVNKTSKKWENEIFIQISESQLARSLRTEKWKYCIADQDSNGSDKPSSNQYTETNLYDLDADPYELNNLIGISTYDEIVYSLRKKIKSKIKKVENITTKITKAKNVNNPGQMGLNPDSFHRLKKKL